MSKLSVLLICALSLIVVQKCHGIMNLSLQDNIVVVAFLPLDENENINYAVIPKLAQYYKDNNIKVILVGGFYGGGPSVPLRERIRLVKAWEEQANCLGFDLIVEVGALPFVDTLALARYCSTLNVTAITTYGEIAYEPTTMSEVAEDLQRVCDAAGSKLPLMYHNLEIVNPKFKTDQVFAAAVDGCVSCFMGCITSVEMFLDCKARISSIDGYQFFGYKVDAVAASLKVGMNASLIIDLFPDLVWKIKDAIKNCQLDLSEDLQQELNRRMYAITNVNGGTVEFASRTYLEQTKAAFQELTCIDVGYRYPLEKPNSTVSDKIRSNLQGMGVPLCDCENKN